ncbi:hypothetical protein MKW92_053134 [Papaver armeniacum]|nr:hypothetical protein MKW92_053134 [Papaver armeniacum]
MQILQLVPNLEVGRSFVHFTEMVLIEFGVSQTMFSNVYGLEEVQGHCDPNPTEYVEVDHSFCEEPINYGRSRSYMLSMAHFKDNSSPNGTCCSGISLILKSHETYL